MVPTPVKHMQLHQIKPTHKKKNKKRVGRGGKRGTYSGRGLKGQKSRSGKKPRLGFAGGSTPLFKKIPKVRGQGKGSIFEKPQVLNLKDLDKHFGETEIVSMETLKEKGLVKKTTKKVKILGVGDLSKKLIFKDLSFSKNALEKIKK